MKKRDRRLVELSRRLDALSISLSDQEALRRIEMTLHRWAEAECNGEIQRDGDAGDGAPKRYYGANHEHSYFIADKERGALERLGEIMARYPHLWYYHQGDPRGCALYVGLCLDLPSGANVSKPDLNSYYTRGVAVCL